MKCCTQCFKAKEVVEFIERAGASGDCDCCGAEGVKTMPAEDLGGMFDPLLSLYEPAKEQTFHIDESLADAVGSWEGRERGRALILDI